MTRTEPKYIYLRLRSCHVSDVVGEEWLNLLRWWHGRFFKDNVRSMLLYAKLRNFDNILFQFAYERIQ